jgi:hypothetical protein
MAYKLSKTTFARGVSLVELITAIGLVGLVSIMVISIYITHFRLFSNQSQSIDLANENRLALDEIASQIKEAQAIVSTCSDCSGYTTSQTTLVLQIWPLDASGNPTNPGGSNYDYIVYKRDDIQNTKLDKKTYPASISSRKAGSNILASDVSNLTFAYYNPYPTVSPDPTLASEVTVSLTNTNTNLGKTNTITQSTEAVLRNK